MTFHEPPTNPRRAGAMTAAMRATSSLASRPALRVGIVRGGKILHDRIFSELATVSIGSAERNLFVVAGASLPQRFDLFAIDDAALVLRFTPEMTGRVTLGGTSFELSALVQNGLASADAAVQGAYVISLSERARGKVSFGDVSVLFECLTSAPRATRPQLPQAVKQSLSKSVDWMFTAFVVGSFISHFGFVVYLESADHPLEDVAERVRTARLILNDFGDPPPPDRNAPPPRATERDPETLPSPRQPNDSHQTRSTTLPKESARAQDQPSDRSAPDASRLAAEAMRQAENLLLGATGVTGGRAFDDLLREGAITTGAEELFAAVAGSGIATHAPSGLINTRQLAEGERTRGLGSLLPGSRDLGPVTDGTRIREREVRAQIEPGEAADEGGSGDLDAAEVTREIKKRLSAIRSCYEHALRRDASLAGKLTVTFTIEPSGTVSHVNVRDDSMRDAGLVKCLASSIALMRMRKLPTGGSVDFSYPFVFRGTP